MILPSRLTLLLGGATMLLVPLCIVASWNWGVSHRALVAERKLSKGYYAEIYTPVTGYRDRLTISQANTLGLMASIKVQNAEVDRLRKAGDDAQRAADARVSAARAQVRDINSLLQAQAREGESQCDAAFRLHQETIR